MSDSPLAVILAAGLGTRMRSRTPKVLHTVGGRPMIDLVLEACREAGCDPVVAVVSPRQPEVAAHLEGRCDLIQQPEQKGSGDALARVAPALYQGRDVVVVNGDAPLLRPASIAAAIALHRQAGAAATLASAEDPGRPDARVVRGADGTFAAIVEHADADQAVRAGGEINVGLYCFRGDGLADALARLEPTNAAGELYLTDLFADLRPVAVMGLADPEEAIGVNDRLQLARAESAMRSRVLQRLMAGGVTIRDPASTFVDAGVEVGRDTVLEPFTVLRGRTVIGEGCMIGPFAWIDDSSIGDGSDFGPFSKLRTGTEIAAGVHVGSFVEMVRSSVGRGSRVPHVSYLGDTTVGAGVNIGAGTITANYDGVNKHPTVIEDGCFVGVDTMFVAPRRMGSGARTGAGSVVTRDIPPGATAVGVPARSIRRRDATGRRADEGEEAR